MALRPDVAVIPEAVEPGRLLERAPELAEASLVWVGTNPHKGLLLAGFGRTRPEFNRHRHGLLEPRKRVVLAAERGRRDGRDHTPSAVVFPGRESRAVPDR